MNRSIDTYIEGEDHVKISHFTRQGFDITGVMHVGANDWYEYEFYKKMGIYNIIGFEPLHEACMRFKAKYPNGELYEVALGKDCSSYLLNVASGDGQSSSFYKMTNEYMNEFPDIKIVRQERKEVITFEKWVKKHKNIRLDYYDCLVVDVEGMELDVLDGFGKYLSNFKYLSVECSGEPTYIKGPTADDIILFLLEKGFIQDSPIEPHNDIMFLRKDMASQKLALNG